MARPKAENSSEAVRLSVDQLKGTPGTATLDQLELDPNNPRIRLQLALQGKTQISGEELLDVIRSQPGYDDLHKQIRDQGAVLEPLIVRHDGRIVEGNTRFAIASALVKTPDGKKKWGKVPVLRLGKTVPEQAIQLLMCNYHISGKTQWRPAAQADQVHLLVAVLKAPIEDVMSATRLSKKRVEQYLAAYDFLLKEVAPHAGPGQRQDVIEKKFHHALEFVTRADLEEFRNDAAARKQIAHAVADGRIQGAEFRKLAPIMKNPRTRETFVRDGFKAAHEVKKRTNPLEESHTVKSAQKLIKELEGLSGKELDIFRTQAKARLVLEQLAEAVQSVLAIATPSKEKRRA